MHYKQLTNNYLLYKLLLFFFLVTICLFYTQATAQPSNSVTNEQLNQWVRQAQKNGLSDQQLDSFAKKQGLSATDLVRLRPQLSIPTNPVRRDTMPARHQNTLPDARKPVPVQTSPVFGAALFQNASLLFEPNLRIPTPQNYILGPDDEIMIDVYGNAQHTYQARISPEGSIRLENLAPIYLNGLTIEQAQQRIVGRLRSVFAGLNTAEAGIYAQVTLTGIRSIRVMVIGQAVRPGTYTLPSLATVFHALYAAGGPTPAQGSFRNIGLYRNNRLVRQIDLYDFLLRADGSADVRLHDGDVIKINHYQTHIELVGEVKQPGLYEVRPDETLQTLLTIAGGFTERAYTATIDLRRPTATEYQIISLPGDQLSTFHPKAGDRYTVGAILNRYTNKVQIEGAVYRPGEYALQVAPTLRQLIRQAEGLRDDAFLAQATIRRQQDNLEPRLISIDIAKLLHQEIADFPLQRDDRIRIFTVGELHENRTVTIRGAVNQGGIFPFADSLTVDNLIAMAGGFTDGASASRIEIARRVRRDTADLYNNQTTRLFTLTTDDKLRLSASSVHFRLEPFDQVFVRTLPHYQSQKLVSITGEVNYTGAYAIRDKQERITDLIARAGGLRPSAFLPAARFIRQGTIVGINFHHILTNPAHPANLLLQEGDSLIIPPLQPTVTISGEVLKPTTVAYEPLLTISDYLNQAGSFSSRAYRRKIYVVRANGQIRHTQSLLGVRRYPISEPGMTIIVPTKPSDTHEKLSTGERIALFSGITSLTALLLTVVRLWTGN